MDLLYRTILFIHVCAGFSGLSLFFVPMIARKGGKVHTRVGWWYVYAMGTVIVTAALLAVLMLLLGDWEYGLFFAFLSLITARPFYFGTVIVRYKRKAVPAYLRTMSLLLLGASVLLSPVLIVMGSGLVTANTNYLLIVFGIIGLPGITEWLGIYRRAELSSDNWLFEHIRGMLISSIAAFTAFFAFGGRRFLGEIFSGNWMLVPWVAPTVLGLIAIKYYQRKYRSSVSKA